MACADVRVLGPLHTGFPPTRFPHTQNSPETEWFSLALFMIHKLIILFSYLPLTLRATGERLIRWGLEMLLTPVANRVR